MKNKTKLILILTAFFVMIITGLSMFKIGKQAYYPPESSSESQSHEYVIKSEGNSVYLFDNGTAVKEYDINVLVLPSEDYELLLNGIKADSIAEADTIAEDFDG